MAEFLKSKGVAHEFRDFQGSTRNSALAASELGCKVSEIAKSVVFVGEGAVVVVISGDKRVDPRMLPGRSPNPPRVAEPEEVRSLTGYPIGGVPPFPHAKGVAVLADVSLQRFEKVWAAAGTPNSVFRIATEDLIGLVGVAPGRYSD